MLTPVQVAAIVVGAVILTALICLSVFFLMKSMRKKKERDSFLDEKTGPRSPQNIPSRMSSTFRTGNAMKIKFNPPDVPKSKGPTQATIRATNSDHDIEPTQLNTCDVYGSVESLGESNISETTSWPLTASFTNASSVTRDSMSPKRVSSGFAFWPLKPSVEKHIGSQDLHMASPTMSNLDLTLTQDSPLPIPQASPATLKMFEDLNAEDVLVEEPQQIFPTPQLAPEPNTEDRALKLPEDENPNYFNDDMAPVAENLDNKPAGSDSEHDALKAEEAEEPPEIQNENLSSVENKPVPQLVPEIKPIIKYDPMIVEDAAAVIPDQSTKQVVAKDQELLPLPSEDQRIQSWNFEQLLPPQQSSRVPSPKTLALLNQTKEPAIDETRDSKMPEIDKLLRMVAQENGNTADKPLFWSDFRPVEPEVEQALAQPPLQEHSVVKEDPFWDVPEDILAVIEKEEKAAQPLDTNVEFGSSDIAPDVAAAYSSVPAVIVAVSPEMPSPTMGEPTIFEKKDGLSFRN